MTIWTDLLGAEVRFIDVSGVSTRVLTAGLNGAEVVLLHGRGGHLESWRANVAQLAEHHRVIAFDLLGHGLTGCHEGAYSVEDLAAHANDTLDRLRVRDAILCGQSIGGWIAALLALRRPELVRSLALIEPAGLQHETERLSDPSVAAAYERGGLAFEEPTTEAVRARLEGLVADPRAIDDELVGVRQRLYAPGAARAVHRAVRTADNTEAVLTDEVLAGLSVPTLLIHGERAHTPQTVVSRAASVCGGRLVTVSGAKQWPHLERPDVVNRLLIEFAARPREVCLT